jgi:pyruvate dehydrogenase (quinone)
VTRIELPADVIDQHLTSEHFAHPLVYAVPRFGPPPAQVAKAAALIDAGKRVTVLCGIGCRDARDAVPALAEQLQAPIVHTLRAKEVFDTSGAAVVGMTGLIGNPAGYHAVVDCDGDARHRLPVRRIPARRPAHHPGRS